MLNNRSILRAGSVTLSLAFALTTLMPAYAENISVKKGTDVKLAFDNSLSSDTAKPGDRVKLHVDEAVVVDGKTVIPEGEKVTGTISRVKKRAHFGVNANI